MFILFRTVNLLKNINLGFSVNFNLNLWWNLGFILIFLIIIQIITGIILSFFVELGFNFTNSKFLLFKENKFFWIFIILHSIIPNFFFIILYLHILKNIIFPIYNTLVMWISGVFIYLTYIIISYTGYSLITTIGFWALTVGKEVLEEVLGGVIASLILFSDNIGICNFTFYKIFTIHYLISFFSIIIIIFHIYYLHFIGNSGGNVFIHVNEVRFLIIGLSKDLLIQGIFSLILFYNIFITPENFISGNFNLSFDKVFSIEISVEWYLRIFFTLLKSIKIKRSGIFFTFIFIIIIFLIPYFKNIWASSEIPLNFYLIIIFITIFIILISNFYYSSFLSSISFILLIFFNIFFLFFLNYSYIKFNFIK
uniref:cytochrome b n=1 Tax=Myxobolus shantungensis TaxID=904554 RepID=UPI003002E4E8